MIKVALVGTGNLASKLYSALFLKNEIQIVGIYGRKPEALADYDRVLTTTDPLALPAADLTIMAVSDDAITEVSGKLQAKHGLLVHTSGAQNIAAIASDRRGVCYPLQTFSKQRAVSFSQVPFCIEAESDEDYRLIEEFCFLLTNSVERLGSAERKYLHLAAVYVNNFVNQLYQIAHEILDEQNLPFDLLYPLIQETAAKVKGQIPADLQTGPAKRNDIGIIRQHLEIQDEDQQEIYKLLTAAIQKSQKI